ncbi:MAG: N-acetylmuramoyl-L-alanine amidase [Bdellovibrionales bacterium]|nr:N-acetylmuramoyl-L-alanine amidase [Bdellovibrionales bacterium]
MKSSLLFIVAILCLSQAHAFTILIDPGHGGEEDGAVAVTQGEVPPRSIKEKDIALEIAKRIYELLQKKNYSVYLTRSVDRTVTLPERAAIAEKTKADLFISVHINSSPESGAVGFETYYLDNHDDVAIKKVEKTENIQSSGDNVVVQQILVDLVVEQTVSTSKPLAESIHSELKSTIGKKYKIPSRGIKPGLFFVLALSKRPGVLLEVGFISTYKERVRMMDPKFQDGYARAVVDGIEKYIKQRNARARYKQFKRK